MTTGERNEKTHTSRFNTFSRRLRQPAHDAKICSHMPADELSAALTALKETQLGFPLLAHRLNDQDVRDIAGYFASVNR